MKELLEIARKTIEFALKCKKYIPDEKLKKKFSEKRACFVTLSLNGQLRGCIGSLVARQELWKDIVSNSTGAAFYDPRFLPLTEKEFKETKIEISVLDEPKRISYSSLEELKQKIKNKGVVLSDTFRSATYLPQVWEDLPEPENFLSSLCIKAGLNSQDWKNKKLDIKVYNVIKIKEKTTRQNG
jgi:AmmeMemoRadiSam system protein A